MTNEGIFIVFEGGEGSGKTTQIGRIVEWIKNELNQDVIRTREPGGSPGAEDIRNIILTSKGSEFQFDSLTDLILMNAARADHVEKTIIPALSAGQIVICDRYYLSSIVYQGYAGDLPLDQVKSICQLASRGINPDLTIILDIEPQIGIERSMAELAATSSSEDRFEKLDLSFHECVMHGLRTEAALAPDKHAIIQADQPIEDVTLEIQGKILDLIGTKAAAAA